MKVLKLGLPKGSLQDATFDLFNRAGFGIIDDAVVSHEGPFVHLEPHAVPDLLPVDARVQLSPENLPCCGVDF